MVVGRGPWAVGGVAGGWLAGLLVGQLLQGENAEIRF